MPGLEDLYREIIIDHNRNPRNRGELPTPPAHKAEGFNPLCGDEIVVYLMVEGDEITDVRIAGQGCSISQSSASMMSMAVKGKRVDEARAITRAFKSMLSIDDPAAGKGESTSDGAPGANGNGNSKTPNGDTPPAEVKLGDLEALRGVEKYPVRIKCATLSWNTLAQGLDEATARPPGD